MSEDRELVLEAGRTDEHYWRELWHYRELFTFLAWRDVLVRYKQTAVGVLWGLMQPVLTMVVFTVCFGRVAKLPSEGQAPYFVMVLAGLLPWQFFGGSIVSVGTSLVNNAGLVGKIYFPRMIVPGSAIVVGLVDFGVTLVLLLVLMFTQGYHPTVKLLCLPAFLLLAMLVALGPGLWLAALNVQYRDVRFVLPFMVQIGLFLSPVGYGVTAVPEAWQTVYALNPMVGVIEGFRWALLGPEFALNTVAVVIAASEGALLAWFGIWYFRRTEQRFADVI